MQLLRKRLHKTHQLGMNRRGQHGAAHAPVKRRRFPGRSRLEVSCMAAPIIFADIYAQSASTIFISSSRFRFVENSSILETTLRRRVLDYDNDGWLVFSCSRLYFQGVQRTESAPRAMLFHQQPRRYLHRCNRKGCVTQLTYWIWECHRDS